MTSERSEQWRRFTFYIAIGVQAVCAVLNLLVVARMLVPAGKWENAALTVTLSLTLHSVIAFALVRGNEYWNKRLTLLDDHISQSRRQGDMLERAAQAFAEGHTEVMLGSTVMPRTPRGPAH